MLQTFGHLLSLIRFSHTIFALPFALLAALMAWRLKATELLKSGDGLANIDHADSAGPTADSVQVGPSDVEWVDGICNPDILLAIRWQELLGIVLCMVFARSGAMAFNRVVDRQLDAENPRTARRHIPAGILSARQVWAFAAASGLAFVASTLFFLPNRLPLYLSVPVLAFLCGYSYTKRFTSLAHVWLGVALALAPLAVWLALRGERVLEHPSDLLPALVLAGAVAAWVAGFDMIYACQDFEFDASAQLRSMPTRLGIAGALRLAAACHALMVLLLAALPWVYPPFGRIYSIAVVAVAGLLIFEHRLVRPDDLARVNKAFFHVNAVISLGLLTVATLDLMLGGG